MDKGRLDFETCFGRKNEETLDWRMEVMVVKGHLVHKTEVIHRYEGGRLFRSRDNCTTFGI